MSHDLEVAARRYAEASEAWIGDAWALSRYEGRAPGAFHSPAWTDLLWATEALKAALRRAGGTVTYRGRTYRLSPHGHVETLFIPPPEEEPACPTSPTETCSASAPPTSRPPSRRRSARSTPGPTLF